MASLDDDLVVADLNGDGTLDIVNTRSNNNTLTTQLGNGDGTFAPRKDYTTGNQPTSVAIGDVNGDGKPDIIVANSADGTIGVFLGGVGALGQQATYAIGQNPFRVRVGDFNGDSKLDVLTINAQDTLSVLLGNGDGTFGNPLSVSTGNGPDALAIGDMNGDGKLDAVVANGTDRTVGVFLGNGSGGFGPQATYTIGMSGGDIPRRVAVGDLNGDGILDVVAGNSSGSISVLLGMGGGTLAAQVLYSSGGSLNSLELTDLNGDAKVDILVTAAGVGGGSVSVLINAGNGTFGPYQPYGAGVHPIALAVGDLDHDGAPDIVVETAGNGGPNDGWLAIILGIGNGTFASRMAYPGGAAAVGDINGDGVPDLATVDPSSATGQANVFVGRPDGTFTLAETLLAGGNGNATEGAVSLGDVNNDGFSDLITADSYGVHVLYGTGRGTFGAPIGLMASNSTSLVVTDLNGDHLNDLVAADFAGNSITILLSVSNGSFAMPISVPTGTMPTVVVVKDINEDNAPDLIVINQRDNTVGVLLGTGLGAFGTQRVFPTGRTPASIAVADFNADTHLDIAVVNFADGTISVMLGDGTGAFSPPVTYASGVAPVGLAAVDLDGDRKIDLIVSNSARNTLGVLFGLGDGTFQPQREYPLGPQAGLVGQASIVVADLNRDGRFDLVVPGASETDVLLSPCLR